MKAVEVIPPGKPLIGAVAPPGSKSITNRALLLAGLAKGASRLTGALKSDDTRWMAQALRAMGVGVDEPDETTFLVEGRGGLAVPEGPLFLGNAGTAMRFLTAAAALVDGTVVLDGDDHMKKRPIGPLVDALAQLGVSASAPTGCPPVTVQGKGGIEGGRVEVDASLSSQYVSALLLAAGCAKAPVEVALKGSDIGARGYVHLTLAAMRRFGAQVETLDGGNAWRIAPGGYRAHDLHIEPDASAATYFWAAAKLTEGHIDLGIAPIGFTQPDARAYELIKMFPHMPSVIEGSQIQDAVPTLAVLAAFNRTPVRFTGIANLRVKECDRVSALSTELSRMRPGLGVEDGDDLIVASDPRLTLAAPARIKTYDDHRIAMSFALAGLRAPGVTILDPGTTAKTFPGYWRALESLGVELRYES